MQQLCTERSFLIELSAVTFAPSFIALFYLRGKTNGIMQGKQIAYGEAICAGVTILLQCRQEGGSLTHTRSDRSHAPDTWLFAAW
jgi:hypothetical protein